MSLDSRNEELEKKLHETDLPQAVEVLVKDAKRRTRQLRWIAISLALDLILTIGLTIFGLKTNEVAKLAQSNKEATIQGCEIANDARDKQRVLWGYVLALTPQQPRTPEQEDRVNEFRGFVDNTFAHRDCQAEATRFDK